MRPCWMLPLMLLGCGSLHAARSPVTCDGSPAPASVGVLVPCQNVTGTEVTFSLLRGQQAVCTYVWRRQDQRRPDPACPGSDARLHSGEDGTFDGFVVTTAMSQSTATYRCEGSITFPPPLKKSLSSPVTLLLVEGRQCDHKKNQSDSAGGGSQTEAGQGSLWVWVTAVALLATYGLVVTVLAAVSLLKLRTTDSYSDYMNTKPRAPRDRRKNRGIQTPVPRHF